MTDALPSDARSYYKRLSLRLQDAMSLRGDSRPIGVGQMVRLMALYDQRLPLTGADALTAKRLDVLREILASDRLTPITR